RRLAVMRTPGPNDVATVRRADALMTKADAQDRDRRAEAAHDIRRDAGLHRCARTWRENDVTRGERRHAVERQRIVSTHDRVPPQFANVPREVVDERIVVVDEENHTGAAKASIMPRALSRVSLYSCSESESATIPPPALKYIRPWSATAVLMA